MKRFLAVAASLWASVLGCDGPQSHVYVAMLYEPAGDCLDPSTTLAIIGTPNGSLECTPPACLVESAPPAGGAPMVYVSTMCPPYPAFVTFTPTTDPACTGPIAAYESGAVCGEDGGTDDGGANGASRDGDAGGATDADASSNAPPVGELGDSSEINDTKSD